MYMNYIAIITKIKVIALLLNLKEQTNLSDFWVARNTKEEVYQQIIKDLQSAEAGIPLT